MPSARIDQNASNGHGRRRRNHGRPERRRRERMVAHRASGHADAEAWDLEFWQAQSPEDRLSALVAIRRDVEAVEAGRKDGHH